MKVAALDLGSNTFLCLIAEVVNQRGVSSIIEVYSDTVEVVRLGQGLEQSKRFHSEALSRADACLKKFSEIIHSHKPEKILAMATSAARDAINKQELFDIAKKHNIPLEIIPGEQEATITYKGAVSGFKEQNQNLMIIDIGGGSTEFIFGRDQFLMEGESYNIGCVRLTERCITSQPTPDNEVNEVTKLVDESILKAKALMPPDFVLDQIIAVAGTPTSLVAAQLGEFDASKIDGFVLTKEGLESWLNKLKNATVDEKIKMGIPSGRADVILIGVIILLRTLYLFGLSQMKVSTRGVRYGVALEMGRRFLSANE
ncbi:Ppx/GppA family phosphatase [bacterium]|nr:Ppx/GppA family phosphatase [bacterium]